MKRVKWLVTLALALGLSNGAVAAREGDEIQFAAVDWKSYERVADRITLWMTHSYDQTVTLAHGFYPHRSERRQYLIDCDRRTYAIAQCLLTDRADGAGQVVWHARVEDPPFFPFIAGSFEGAVFHAACSIEPTTAVAARAARAFPGAPSPTAN